MSSPVDSARASTGTGTSTGTNSDVGTDAGADVSADAGAAAGHDLLAKLLQRGDTASLSRLARPMVFTNGVFDILHRGHVSYLVAARALGASLVLGLNSDRSARSLGKGPDRPLNRELDRACVLCALQAVDAVLLFDEATPVALLGEVKPDLYVKGGDYDIETLAETALVRSWGGQALALPFVDGYSTSALVQRIEQAHPTR